MSSTATTTLSADDVRRLVTTAWCTTCNRPHTGHWGNDHHPAVQSLFTRCPGCQPEGLLWNSWRPLDGGHWDLCTDLGHTSRIAPYHAIDLILMSIARDATAAHETIWRSKACDHDQDFRGKVSECYDNIVTAIMNGDLPGAVAARHRLKDLEDKP